MSTVNDLMTYLSSRLGITLPVLPLPSLLSGLTALWQATVSNWSSGENVPTDVTITVPANTKIDLAGAELSVKSASIKLSQPVNNS